MKIGYPCINRSVRCKGARTFRLKSYSESRLVETVRDNLDCLMKILQYNVENNLLFFRITSDLVPFASHPICQFDWVTHFTEEFASLGAYIRSHNLRISMHPGQYTLLNSPDSEVLRNSVKELQYHADVLDALRLDDSAKIQIHAGGVYGDMVKSTRRFLERYDKLSESIRRRLILENDDRSYKLKDCLAIHVESGIPVLADAYHHDLNNGGETLAIAVSLAAQTWGQADGIPMVDYSHRKSNGRGSGHAESLDRTAFAQFLSVTRPFDFDIMLEIKDKERSALQAVQVASDDERFRTY